MQIRTILQGDAICLLQGDAICLLQGDAGGAIWRGRFSDGTHIQVGPTPCSPGSRSHCRRRASRLPPLTRSTDGIPTDGIPSLRHRPHRHRPRHHRPRRHRAWQSLAGARGHGPGACCPPPHHQATDQHAVERRLGGRQRQRYVGTLSRQREGVTMVVTRRESRGHLEGWRAGMSHGL